MPSHFRDNWKVLESVGSIRLFVSTLPFKLTDTWLRLFAWVWIMTIVRQEMKVKVTAQGQRWMQRCVCYTSTYFDVLSILIGGRISKFSLWRHQLRTSAERRAAWRGRIQQQRRSPARSISFGVTSIDNCFHRGMEAAFMRWSCLSVCFVCLFVCPSVRAHISGSTCPIFSNFQMHVTCGHGSVLLYQRYGILRTSGFANDVIFAQSGRMETCRYRCSEWRHCVVVRRLTSPLRRIGCVGS